ncbi:MAG TPA: polyhydroxyalkanoate synthesis regulator [Bacteroidetes bacterium]|nr:polyhydroxyalkanoate synthesis regulator [Bacteroidota bacterium]
MKDLIGKAFLAGLGAVSLTREKLESVVDDLVKRGEVAREEKQKLLNDLVEAGEKHQNEIRGFIQKEVKKALEALDIPTRQDIRDLQKQIEKLGKSKN